jgi:hypothetical protein
MSKNFSEQRSGANGDGRPSSRSRERNQQIIALTHRNIIAIREEIALGIDLDPRLLARLESELQDYEDGQPR